MAVINKPMRVGTLNVRGLSSRRKRCQLYRLGSDVDLDILAVQETKVDDNEETGGMVKLRLHWRLYGVSDEDVRVAFAAFEKAVEATQEVMPVEVDEAAATQGETSGSGDEMSVTSATLKISHDKTREVEKTSSTSNEEPTAKTHQ
ncbi:hypothetical protein HPB50_028590 [Hyalomma asiaticum]|nr:hypothetical protein HPB50_028590 [Hyalomma asiaticum]